MSHVAMNNFPFPVHYQSFSCFLTGVDTVRILHLIGPKLLLNSRAKSNWAHLMQLYTHPKPVSMAFKVKLLISIICGFINFNLIILPFQVTPPLNSSLLEPSQPPGQKTMTAAGLLVISSPGLPTRPLQIFHRLKLNN